MDFVSRNIAFLNSLKRDHLHKLGDLIYQYMKAEMGFSQAVQDPGLWSAGGLLLKMGGGEGVLFIDTSS